MPVLPARDFFLHTVLAVLRVSCLEVFVFRFLTLKVEHLFMWLHFNFFHFLLWCSCFAQLKIEVQFLKQLLIFCGRMLLFRPPQRCSLISIISPVLVKVFYVGNSAKTPFTGTWAPSNCALQLGLPWL